MSAPRIPMLVDRLIASDAIAETDLMLALHRLFGDDTDTTCTALLAATRRLGMALQDPERFELSRCVYRLADELGYPSPNRTPNP